MEKLDQLVWAMIKFYRGDAKQIQHFTKVHTYADWIARWEGVDQRTRDVIAAVTLTHDIGIGVAKEKYGMSSWRLQEQEGPAAAERILEEIGFDSDLIRRVCYLIGHHHTYTNIDGLDYQILVEADFLVNFQEGNQPLSAIPSVYETIFRTRTGRELLCQLYNFVPETE